MLLDYASLVFATVATLTGAPADASATALDAVAQPGAVTLTGEVAGSSASALDATATPGAASITGSPADGTASALDALAVPGSVTITGALAAASATALDGVATPAVVTLTGDPAGGAATALDGSALPGAVTLAGGLCVASASALDALAGYAAPRGVGSLSLALPVRRASVSVPSRSVLLALPRRSATAALPVRAVALALPRRFAVADIQGFTQGDRCESSHTLTSTLLGVAQTIAEPLSLVARLYARGSTTLVTSVSVVVADCTGWGTTSVTAPVIYTSEISAALPVGTYSVWLVGAYANGTVRWPENGTSIPLEVRAPGST